ncbi:hypothetical protein [Schlesneria paludicola]|uniref:hypothetical protein n=1 Tax=Schlesneria paludicola TaxID=360056 RepID=UPI00030F859B|nr:hypothetical protein [Schlesneria paludicola]
MSSHHHNPYNAFVRTHGVGVAATSLRLWSAPNPVTATVDQRVNSHKETVS